MEGRAGDSPLRLALTWQRGGTAGESCASHLWAVQGVGSGGRKVRKEGEGDDGYFQKQRDRFSASSREGWTLQGQIWGQAVCRELVGRLPAWLGPAPEPLPCWHCDCFVLPILAAAMHFASNYLQHPHHIAAPSQHLSSSPAAVAPHSPASTFWSPLSSYVPITLPMPMEVEVGQFWCSVCASQPAWPHTLAVVHSAILSLVRQPLSCPISPL